MLHIRLRRIGKKKQPTYRLIVCEKAKDPYGDYLENLGTYNPRTSPSEIVLKEDRIKDWISKGAQCSDTVWNMLIDKGVVKGEKRKSIDISKKRKAKLEQKSADKTAADEAKKVADEAAKVEQEEVKEEVKEPEAEDVGASQDVEESKEAPVGATQASPKEEEAPASEAPSEPSDESPPAEEKKDEPPAATEESPSAEATGDEEPKQE
jgi:small subunit ribosomal protein S16